MNTTWILILFLKYSYAGGVVQMPGYVTIDQCSAALAEAKQARSFQDAICIPAPQPK